MKVTGLILRCELGKGLNVSITCHHSDLMQPRGLNFLHNCQRRNALRFAKLSELGNLYGKCDGWRMISLLVGCCCVTGGRLAGQGIEWGDGSVGDVF